jgi:hypothetical protein
MSFINCGMTLRGTLSTEKKVTISQGMEEGYRLNVTVFTF